METEHEQKKNLIIDAAFDIFLEKGYTNAKMAEVAARAGLAKATLYDYFDSKESLFSDLLESKAIQPYYSILAQLDKTSTCESRIRRFMGLEMDFLFNLFREKNILPALLLHTEMITNASIASATHRIIQLKFRALHALVKEGVDSGEFFGDPATATACLIGASNFYTACVFKLESGCIELPPGSPAFPELPESQTSFFETVFNGLRVRK
ncbi:MAG: TetR/AcrR family transcriptional regulator [Clostridiales Family XIII bacterium]|jgi:AcrR family transcriptional regulator|nr:TetR/AcrR family transcriptional regulator [Clostridiales Family XIII bacterium]